MYRGLVRSVLANDALLDRVEAGDPGAPARVMAPHVAGGAATALRLGKQFVEWGVLRDREQEQNATPLRSLLARAERLMEG